MQKTTITVINEVGLHARPASEFVKLASHYQAKITVRNLTTESQETDAKSILGVLTLGVEKGHQIELIGDGVDEKEAIQALSELIESDFAGMF